MLIIRELKLSELIKKYSNIDHCPVRNIISRFSSKWAMLILMILSEETTLRFNELSKCLPDISPKVLSSTLKTLEDDGLISRKVYPTVPPKVEYSLTQTGTTLIPLLKNLTQWAITHYGEIVSTRRINKRS